MNLEIKKYGNPILRQETETIKEINSKVTKLAYNMIKTMYSLYGIGIAAPQVGFPLKLCIVMDQKYKKAIIMINPKIIPGKTKIKNKEGCLSIPGFYENIERFNKIIVNYTDLNNKHHIIEAYDMFSVIVQHEIDHLNGKLFIDYLSKTRKEIIENEIKKRKDLKIW
ncbi:MAG: peptide deformylase [Endomicrobium sp.]|jgi:peptide deformylase|nr:peptide deformylase [Endomicrobium sp.]